jgi:dipeptidyl-peptidase-4
LIPSRDNSTSTSSSGGGGGLYVQSGLHEPSVCLSREPAVDAQLSPDATLVAWHNPSDGELYVKSATASADEAAVQITFGAQQTEHACIRHGVADFLSQEEMDRYRGYWWHPDSTGVIVARVDESKVPLFRIMHHQDGSQMAFEDHRYPFAGKDNPIVQLGFLKIDNASLTACAGEQDTNAQTAAAAEIAAYNWSAIQWFDAPREANEYLARVHWLPDGSFVSQWQNRAQTVSVLYRVDLENNGRGRTLLIERSNVWINLHNMFHVLPEAIHPDECSQLEPNIPPFPEILPHGSCSFILASERSGYSHLYLYTYCPGINGELAVLLRTITAGEWCVEHIAGVNSETDVVYFTGTYDSVLERHLYALPLRNRRDTSDDESNMSMSPQERDSSPNGVRHGIRKVIHVLSGRGSSRSREKNDFFMRPIRLTQDSGMHCIVMDETCRYFVDSSSDLDRPTSVRVYELAGDFALMANGSQRETTRLVTTLYDAVKDDKSFASLRTKTNGSNTLQKLTACFPAPEMMSFPAADGSDTLYAAVYRPDARFHGPGPYPLVCAVYGGPHVQRVNRSWSQCADLRAQRLRNLGFCVVKCDNRGSSRRGLAFESEISRRLGRVEVLDQVAAVRQLTMRGIADASRVGVYGWSYGGYLSAMCLFRAPDVFHVAVAGAPVTSWDGYDTHYTERYMGLPAENLSGYRESSVFDHVPNMRGKLMIVHGLIDENVHFRHTARLINKLTDLLVFPDERHSPRRLRDRVYMEQRISEYFVRHLSSASASHIDLVDQALSQSGMHGVRQIASHL